jgi:hypothetical protein
MKISLRIAFSPSEFCAAAHPDRSSDCWTVLTSAVSAQIVWPTEGHLNGQQCQFVT